MTEVEKSVTVKNVIHKLSNIFVDTYLRKHRISKRLVQAYKPNDKMTSEIINKKAAVVLERCRGSRAWPISQQ
jgi:hypothetical protein